jgi:hypothetical protein
MGANKKNAQTANNAIEKAIVHIDHPNPFSRTNRFRIQIIVYRNCAKDCKES